ELGFLAGGEIGVHNTSGGRLIELLGGEIVFLAQLIQGAVSGDLFYLLNLRLDRPLGGTVGEPAFLDLANVLLGAARMWHRYSPVPAGSRSIPRKTTLRSQRRVSTGHVGLLHAFLPFVEQPADVSESEIEIGQLVGEIDRLGQVAAVRGPLGELEQDLLA